MTPRAKKVLRWSAAIVGGLVVLIGGLLWWGLSSESAARRVIGMALGKSDSAGVRIGQVHGRLSGPLYLTHVTTATQTYAASIDSIELDWSPSGLIQRQVRIDRLHVTGVHLVLPDSTPRDTAAPQRLKLPMDVLLGDVLVQQLTVDAPGDVHVRNGTVRVTGRAEDYRIVAHALATAPALTDTVPLDLAGTGNLDHMMLSRATAELLRGRVIASGRLGWFPNVSWNLNVHADSVHPALMLQDPSAWPGAVSAWAKTAGHLDTLGPVGRAVVDSIGGSLRAQPLRGTLAVGFTGQRYDIPSLDVNWGSAHAVASGTVADSVDVRYTLDVANLATAMPGVRGKLALDGTATGARLTPRVRTTIAGSNIVYGTNRVRRLIGRADLDLAEGGRNVVDLRGDHASVGTTAISRVVMGLRGTQARHHMTAAITAPMGTLQLGVTGGLQGKAWSGRVAALDVQSTSAGHWRLERPATLTASADAASVGDLCLHSERTGDARICAGGDWWPAGWRARSVIEHFPLAALDSIMPAGQHATGTLDGRLDASATGQAIAGRLAMYTTGAALEYQLAADTAPRRILLDSAGVNVQAGRDGVHGTMSIRASGDTGRIGQVNATFALPAYNRLGLVLKRQPVTLHLDGDVPSLAFARPFVAADSLGGALKLLVNMTGTVGAPNASGSLNLSDFAIWMPQGRAARGSVDVTLTSNVASDRSVVADLRVVPRGVIYDYTLDLVPQRLRVDSGGLQVTVGDNGLHGALALGISDTTGTRLLSSSASLDLPNYRELGTPLAAQAMHARAAATIPDLSFARIAAAGFDSLGGKLQLDAGAEGTAAAPRVTGTLRITDLAARMVEGSLITGAIDGDLTAAVANDSSLTADFRIAPRDMVISHLQNGTPRRMLVDSTALTMRVGRDGLHGTLGFQVTDSGGARLGVVNGTMALPQYTRLGDSMAAQPLTAQLNGRIDDLAFAEAFSPATDSLAGRVTLDLNVSGTMGAPRLVGGVALKDGAARVPRLGQLFHDIQFTASGDQTTSLRLDGHATAGPGQVTITGTYPVSQTAANPARISVKGERFEAMNTPEVHAIITPDLSIVMTSSTIDVTGTVELPLVHVTLAEIPEFAVAPSDDVIFTDTLGGGSAAAPVRSLSTNVRIVLGDSVSFKGFNFTASLGGAIQATQAPGRPALGSGTVVIREGQYKAYGQDLTITNGLVRFAGGPVDNPGLNIRAQRLAEDSVVAGLQIGGTLKSPDVTIFSNPSMSQNRALEYIVLGHPMGENTGGPQGSLLSKAVSSAGLRGGNLIAKTLGKGVGLDEARLETKGDLRQASFVAGRYLSPNLYVTYGIGLFDPISTLRLRYTISQHWTLQAERGQAVGADVLYKVERGDAKNLPAAPPTVPPPTAPPTSTPPPAPVAATSGASTP
ncbi:MAG: translocation/assembly module TamB domain-containing protein [Gemmatimonadota bacterium]